MNPDLQRARNQIIAFALGGLAIPSAALDIGDGGIQIGPVTVHPSIKISTRYDDNIFASNTNKKSAIIGIIAPAVKLIMQDNIRQLTLDYSIDSGSFQNSDPDDYIDQELLGVFTYIPTSKIKMELRAEYLDEHDPRGTARTEGTGATGPGSSEPDEWHSLGIGGLVSYGSPNATGRVEFETTYVDKEYDNNRQETFVRDRNDFMMRGTFYYRIRPKTQLSFEINQTIFEYENDDPGVPSLDSTNRNYLFGVIWDRTYKTTGFAKFGYTEKNFDSNLRDDVGQFKWETGTIWRPRTYSTVRITTTRRQDETNGIGDSIDVGEFNVSWDHEWRNRISTTIDFLYGEDDYSNSTEREDNRYSAGIRVDYDWLRWAKISTGYRYEERDSSIDTFDYERSLLDLTINFSL